MIELGLTLVASDGPVREAVAWFIPGGDVARWLGEIGLWGVRSEGLKLYPVPVSAGDRRACGVLVTGVQGKRAKAGIALPYGVVGGRLYVPVDGRIEPEVSGEELAALLTWDVQVLHPTAGLVGFAAADALGVADLIAGSGEREVSWGHAVPGVGWARRLAAIEVEMPPAVEDVLDEGRDDIGSEAAEDVPVDPGESKLRDAIDPLVGPLMEKMGEWAKKLGQGIGAGKGAGASGKGGAAAPGPQKSSKWKERLEALRNRELDRLSKLLERDPDRGLMYALPLSGPAERGRARQGYRLGARWPVFNLAWFRGGQPADVWDVPDRMRQKLTEQYRKAANRELALGRYKRAAYIFGHLLGDFAAAADALKRGRQFREAAVLYREKLRNKWAAAECLEKGGLIPEAIEAYEELGEDVKAGDLAALIGREEEAERLYRAAVTKCAERNDPMGAAKLLEEKLKRPDEALELLEKQWPASRSAGVCLGAWFGLVGRLGRHDVAARRVAKLAEEDVLARLAVTLVDVAAGVARTYPDEAVKRKAADVALRTAGVALLIQDSAGVVALTRAVASLAPHDRLLSRDADRYAGRTRKEAVRPPAPVAQGRWARESAADRKLPVVASYRLPGAYRWTSAAAVGTWGFCGVGLAVGKLAIARMSWRGEADLKTMVLQFRNEDASPRVLAGAGGDHVRVVSEGMPLSVPVRDRRCIFYDSGARRLECYVMDEFGSELVGACTDEHGGSWTLTGTRPSELTLTYRAGAHWSLIRSTFAVSLPGDELRVPVPMAAHRGAVFIGAGRHLVRVDEQGNAPAMEVPSVIRSLVVPGAMTRTRVLATSEEGAVLVTMPAIGPALAGAEYERIGQGVAGPVGAFLPDGGIVLARAGGGGAVYRRDGGAWEVAKFGAPGEPVAVMPAGPGRFAVVGRGGEVTVVGAGGR